MAAPEHLTAYYFRHHMYSLVPRHVREDLAWMADLGTTGVALAVLEQDLYAAKYNLDIICAEAARAGLAVHAVPSRWGALVAGAPKVPSHFTASHPETWILKADGAPYQSPINGPLSSVHHAATGEFFARSLEQLLAWPFAGVIWDEIKLLDVPDHSPAAIAALGRDAPMERHIDAAAAFFAAQNAVIRRRRPDCRISLFIHSFYQGHAAAAMAAMPGLDFFGCDGRPWAVGDPGALQGEGKVLLPHGARFIELARRHGRGGLLLIENHDLPAACNAVMDRRLPEVLALGAEHVLYYYYPRNLEDPEATMAVVARHLRRR